MAHRCLPKRCGVGRREQTDRTREHRRAAIGIERDDLARRSVGDDHRRPGARREGGLDGRANRFGERRRPATIGQIDERDRACQRRVGAALRIDAHQRPRHAPGGGRRHDRLGHQRGADVADNDVARSGVEMGNRDGGLFDRVAGARELIGEPVAARIVAGAARALRAETDIGGEVARNRVARRLSRVRGAGGDGKGGCGGDEMAPCRIGHRLSLAAVPAAIAWPRCHVTRGRRPSMAIGRLIFTHK